MIFLIFIIFDILEIECKYETFDKLYRSGTSILSFFKSGIYVHGWNVKVVNKKKKFKMYIEI